MSLKIIFAGTPLFALPTLEALQNSPYEVIAVFTQPDRPAGRGQKLTPSPLKTFALSHALPIFQPKLLQARALQELAPDLMIVVAYGLILPKEILEIPRLGCLNLHPSLLPRWRGAAPIQHTLLHGDTMTGLTIIQMDEGMDSGPILLQKKYSIKAAENSVELQTRLAKAGAALMLEAIHALACGLSTPQPQEESLATYAPKIKKSQGLIDWQQPAIQIFNKIRAFNSWPVAFTYLHGQPLKIWEAKIAENKTTLAPPGTIVSAGPTGIFVATGSGVLELLTLQLPGKRQLSAPAFFNAQHTEFKQGKIILSSSGKHYEK